MVGYDQALAPSYARWKSAHPAGNNNKGVASAANSGAFSHTSGCCADDTSPAIRFQTWGNLGSLSDILLAACAPQ